MNGDFSFKVGDVGARASAHVVEDGDFVPAGDTGICEVGTDEACSACDEYAHRGSLSIGERSLGCLSNCLE